jgi:glycerol kinase
MQSVADILEHPIYQCDAPEASALGAAYLAGLTLGVWPDIAAIAALPRGRRLVSPNADAALDTARKITIWSDAIARSTQRPSSFMGE